MTATTKNTPLMQRYRAVKAETPGAMLLFRVGDFYELFGSDAEVASLALGLTLTIRDRESAHPVPMAGFPYHALEGYLAKLIHAGHRVAVCEQSESGPLTTTIHEKRSPMTEQELLAKARLAVTSCNWLLGECAHEWTVQWSRGRTDVVLAELIGGDTQPGHIGRCRRVWREFCTGAFNEGSGLAEVEQRWPLLSWSHFDKARAYGEDAARQALDWAQENDAPIRSMIVWVGETWPELRTAAQQLEEKELQMEALSRETAVPSVDELQAASVDYRPEPRSVGRAAVESFEADHSEGDDEPYSAAAGDRPASDPESGYAEEYPEVSGADVESRRDRSRLEQVVRSVLRSLKTTGESLGPVWASLTDAEQQQVFDALEPLVALLAPAEGDAQSLHKRLHWLEQKLTKKFWVTLSEADRLYLAGPIESLHGVAMSTWRAKGKVER